MHGKLSWKKEKEKGKRFLVYTEENIHIIQINLSQNLKSIYEQSQGSSADSLQSKLQMLNSIYLYFAHET